MSYRDWSGYEPPQTAIPVCSECGFEYGYEHVDTRHDDGICEECHEARGDEYFYGWKPVEPEPENMRLAS